MSVVKFALTYCFPVKLRPSGHRRLAELVWWEIRRVMAETLGDAGVD